MSKQPRRLYCYVDETGQDPRSQIFIVVVIVLEEDRDVLLQLLTSIEIKSGKGIKKWTNSTQAQRLNYLSVIAKDPRFKNKVFFSRFVKPTNYLHATAAVIRRVIRHLCGNNIAEVNILIDGLDKASRRRVTTLVRNRYIRLKTVRGVRDESDARIRFSDAMAGLIRASAESEESATKVVRSMTRKGTLTEIK